MAEAFKCDVVNCDVLADGSAPGHVVVNDKGVKKAMCQKHTDALVHSYFPDLEVKEEAAPATPAAA